MSIFDDAKTAAKSLEASLGKLIDTVAAGNGILVSDQVRMKRMALCQACPEYKKPLGQCGKCLCFCSVKTTLKTEQCPLDKWGQDK
jgi:hypothetical protein